MPDNTDYCPQSRVIRMLITPRGSANGPTTMENTLAISNKVKHTPTHDQTVPLEGSS